MDPNEPITDAWLDAELRRVAVPRRLAERVLWATAYADEELEAGLRDVPIPRRLRRRLGQIVRRRHPLAPPTLAASLALVACLAYVGLMAIHVVANRGRATEERRLERSAVAALPPAGSTIAATAPAAAPADAIASATPGPIQLERLDRGGWLPDVVADLPGQWRGEAGPAVDPFLDPRLVGWPVMTAHTPLDNLPELGYVLPLAPRGSPPPAVEGFDLAFFLRFGVHPFVAPAAHPRLRTATFPLHGGQATFDLAKRCLAKGELPPPASIRTEDFLAALDYAFPQPAADLGLAIAGGPSPFGGEGLRLLHVGVQARRLGPVARDAIHATLAVDTSASMNIGGRLDAVRRALGDLPARLATRDRVSLVAFGERARPLLLDAGFDAADALRTVLAPLTATGGTNIAAALREAYAASATAGRNVRRRVVLLTDGLAELDAGGRRLLEGRIAAAAESGITLDVVQLADAGREGALDEQLAAFARCGRGRLFRAADADEIGWSLAEIVTGVSQVVATDARVTITFNPAAVAEYRLLGHESTGLGGLVEPRAAGRFHSGQAASGLYELRLKPNPPAEVATLELAWNDPRTGQPRRAVRGLGRSDFAATFGQAAASLQAATLAAQVAEILRGSPFAARPVAAAMARVLDVAASADSRLGQRAAMADLLTLARQAQTARQPPAPRRG